MLTELQKQKWTHYFWVLDQDRNGVLEAEDFVEIGEALCVLWRFKPGTEMYEFVTNRCMQNWHMFKDNFETLGGRADLQGFLQFANYMLSPEGAQVYNDFVRRVISETFDFFDFNKDGVISINEYVDMFMAYHIPIKYSAKAFIKLDRDGDEEVTKEELLTATDEFFKSDNLKAPGNWLFGFWGDKED